MSPLAPSSVFLTEHSVRTCGMFRGRTGACGEFHPRQVFTCEDKEVVVLTSPRPWWTSRVEGEGTMSDPVEQSICQWPGCLNVLPPYAGTGTRRRLYCHEKVDGVVHDGQHAASHLERPPRSMSFPAGAAAAASAGAMGGANPGWRHL